MVFRSSPRRRLVVQAEIKPGRPKRQAPKAYGVWSRRLGGYGVGFPQGGRRMAVFVGRAQVKIGGFCAPTPPAAMYLSCSQIQNEWEIERADSTRGKQRETRTGSTWN